MINGDVIGQVLTWRESKISRRDIVPRVCDTSRLITIHGLIINSAYFSSFAARTNARSCSRVKCRGAITNRRKNDNDADGTFRYRIDLSPPRAVIRYRSNVSLHLASDYYLVNIDSQLAPALMRQRIASSSHMSKTLSTIIATQPRNFMQTLSCSPFDPMIIHRFIIKHDSTVTNLDSFFLVMDEIH